MNTYPGKEEKDDAAKSLFASLFPLKIYPKEIFLQVDQPPQNSTDTLSPMPIVNPLRNPK
jgi:hypothetical protein